MSQRPCIYLAGHVRSGDTRCGLTDSESVLVLGEGMAQRGHGGRRSKGDRDQIITRPPRAVGDAVRAAADNSGMSISDYIAKVLADLHGLPELAPAAHLPVDQGVLPIEKGGARLRQSA
jgi:hypothetical protein